MNRRGFERHGFSRAAKIRKIDAALVTGNYSAAF
jgi:hypothetical protein